MYKVKPTAYIQKLEHVTLIFYLFIHFALFISFFS